MIPHSSFLIPLFSSTRRRLALWYTTVTAVLLLLFATGVYLYVRNTLIDRIDDTLKHIVEVVDRSLIIEPIPAAAGNRLNVAASFRINHEVAEDDHIDLEWFNPAGERLWSTFNAPPPLPLQVSRYGQTVSLGPDHLLRQVTKPIERGRQVLGYLRVSHPWFEVTKPIRQLLVDLSLGIVAMVGIVAAVGWFLSGLAMKPIGESYQQLKQFTADASHELRNPIAMIQTNAQTALREDDPLMQRHQWLVVERLSQRLSRLVNDLLFLARSDSGMVALQRQEIPLDALLMEVLEEQRGMTAEGEVALAVEITPPPEEPEALFMVRGDWDQLVRLLTNLISNALIYTGLKSTGLKQVRISLTVQPPDYRIEIRDTGIGIPPEAIAHLFDRFYRVDPARTGDHEGSRGTGLGLAIARVIVEQHQGTITISSELDQGTTVTVKLPMISKHRP